MASDYAFLRRALELAEQGRGFVEPNPLVGAVVARGRLVSEGWHERFGQAHAEVNALREAGDAALGAALYVTLEPCCHYGKTPPCTDAIIAAGIKRVVVAMLDPFPQVAGQGVARLRDAGIAVEVGLLEDEARRLNAPYLKLLSTGRPYVHAKWAMTLDGKIATRTGDSKWISNEISRNLVHRLRGVMDAIVVGIGTALADDPLLTARPPGPRTAARVILDTCGRLPLSSRLVQTARQIPTLVVTAAVDGESQVPNSLDSLRDNGCEVLSLPGATRPGIETLLDELGRRRTTNILVEGGAAVLGSFADADAIDEFHVFIAPRLLGGQNAPSPLGGTGAAHIADALRLTRWHTTALDGDLYIHGWRR